MSAWNEYERLVIGELKRLTEQLDGLTEEITNCRLEIRELKVKSGIWGAIGGAATAAIAIVVATVKGKV